MQARLCARRARLRHLRGHLGACGLELGLGPLQRGLADVFLLVELLLAAVLARGHLQRSAGGQHLGVAGGSALVGGARINAQQQLARLHPVARLHGQLDHGAADLGGDHGLAHGLDHAVKAAAPLDAGHLRRHCGQHGRRCGGGSGGQRHRQRYGQGNGKGTEWGHGQSFKTGLRYQPTGIHDVARARGTGAIICMNS